MRNLKHSKASLAKYLFYPLCSGLHVFSNRRIFVTDKIISINTGKITRLIIFSLITTVVSCFFMTTFIESPGMVQ